MTVGLLTLDLYLPGCSSLKEKRRRLKPLVHRLHREFNISVAEMDHQDIWQNATLMCALVSNDPAHVQRALQTVSKWIEEHWPDLTLVNNRIELL